MLVWVIYLPFCMLPGFFLHATVPSLAGHRIPLLSGGTTVVLMGFKTGLAVLRRAQMGEMGSDTLKPYGA